MDDPLPDLSLGPRTALLATPARQPGSLRRTSTIDTRRPTADEPHRVVEGRARDLLTGTDGEGIELDRVEVLVRVEDATWLVVDVAAEPADPRLAGLAGTSTMQGFRRRLAEELGDTMADGSLVALLLDDMPGAQLVAGYGAMYDRPPAERAIDPAGIPLMLARADTCAGWADDGVLLTRIRAESAVPVLIGPEAPSLPASDDPDAWHELPTLVPLGMRRSRRLDLLPSADGTHRFEAHFRDAHIDEVGVETSVHEYLVRGVVDGEAGVLVEVEAEALSLPYAECPNALASAPLVVGTPLAELRPLVHRRFAGLGTCTHLNDTFRSLADLDALLAHLPS